MCNKPLQAVVIGQKPDGKNILSFKKYKQMLPHWRQVELPCGRCIACRLEKTRVWGMRAEHEAKFHDENCFITLTYNEEALPPSLEKRPLQLFIKRLRKSIEPIKIKYIASGELGDNYDNPHYHICVFGYMPQDLQHLYERDGNNYYISKKLEMLWPFGFHTITHLNFQTARYTAKYAIKKELGVPEEERKHPPEFFVVSQGIGKAHAEKYSKDMAEKGKTFANGYESALPRYYKEKIKESENKEILNNTLEKSRLTIDDLLRQQGKGDYYGCEDFNRMLSAREKIKRQQVNV